MLDLKSLSSGQFNLKVFIMAVARAPAAGTLALNKCMARVPAAGTLAPNKRMARVPASLCMHV